jgi:hypothetical protein
MPDAYTVVKLTTEVMSRANGLYQKMTTRELKATVEDLVDTLHELKRLAIVLEDEKRGLEEKLRFKSEEYKFDGHFFYHKDHPEEPLCPGCHANFKDANMSPVIAATIPLRKCFACDKCVYLRDEAHAKYRTTSAPIRSSRSPWV